MTSGGSCGHVRRNLLVGRPVCHHTLPLVSLCIQMVDFRCVPLEVQRYLCCLLLAFEWALPAVQLFQWTMAPSLQVFHRWSCYTNREEGGGGFE